VTNSNRHLREIDNIAVAAAGRSLPSNRLTFTMESGEPELREGFAHVERHDMPSELVITEGRLQLTESNRMESVDELMAIVAVQIASLMTSEEPALVKRCAGPACTLSFLDRTKSHRRAFCSAAACGNRAKVAAFRERQRKG